VLRIELERALEPGEMGEWASCGICGCHFEGESVMARILDVG